MSAWTPAAALVSIAIGYAAPDPAHAALGADARSIAADAMAWHGSVRTTSGTRYDVAEIRAEPDVDVREYLNREGIVFAVTWRARVMPDLSGLLGAYFLPYTLGLASMNHPGLQRTVSVASAEAVVQNGGHLRAYAGRAYLPSLMPDGVLLADLR